LSVAIGYVWIIVKINATFFRLLPICRIGPAMLEASAVLASACPVSDEKLVAMDGDRFSLWIRAGSGCNVSI
jgi:hypothetical protein